MWQLNRVPVFLSPMWIGDVVLEFSHYIHILRSQWPPKCLWHEVCRCYSGSSYTIRSLRPPRIADCLIISATTMFCFFFSSASSWDTLWFIKFRHCFIMSCQESDLCDKNVQGFSKAKQKNIRKYVHRKVFPFRPLILINPPLSHVPEVTPAKWEVPHSLY